MKRRSFLKSLCRVAGVSAAALTGLAGAGYGYTHTAKFGARLSGEAIASFASLPYWSGEAFRNIHAPTFANATGKRTNMLTLLLGTGDRRPDFGLPANPGPFVGLVREVDQIIWFGHSTFFIQLDGKRILIDPIFSDCASPVPYTVRPFPGTNIYTVADFPGIDIVAITHDHWDHLDYQTILQLQDKAGEFVCPLGVGEHLRKWGIPAQKIHELTWHQSIDLAEIRFTCTPGHHFSGRTFVRNRTLWGGFVFTGRKHKLYLSGDTGHASHFDEIAHKYGPFDCVMLDCGQYNPQWRQSHMMPEDTADAAVRLKTKALIPAHIGKFSISVHSWHDPFDRIVQASKDKDYRLLTPGIGDAVVLEKLPDTRHWWKGLGLYASNCIMM